MGQKYNVGRKHLDGLRPTFLVFSFNQGDTSYKTLLNALWR